jgi:hypothetical protein
MVQRPGALLAHVSPALMEHVNPYGTYEFPVEAEYARQGFRPLRQAAQEGERANSGMDQISL